MANERVREVAEGRAEPFEPIQVNDRQRKALESALGDASQPWDTVLAARPGVGLRVAEPGPCPRS